MPRERKKTTTPVETPVSTDNVTASTSAAAAETAPPADSAVVEPPVPLPTSPSAEPPPAETATPDAERAEPSEPRGRFRSWVTDVGRGYHRLTDEQENRLVLLFDAKPAADVLTAIKGAGFHYHPDYCGQPRVWVRRNDFEGRLQVEAIEKLIGTIPTRDSAAR